MHIEEGNAIAFTQFATIDVAQVAADLVEPAGRDVTRHQWVGHTMQMSLLQEDICAADFR